MDNSWKVLLEQLESRRGAARAMGGPERVARLITARGKLDARARLEKLFDQGTEATNPKPNVVLLWRRTCHVGDHEKNKSRNEERKRRVQKREGTMEKRKCKTERTN